MPGPLQSLRSLLLKREGGDRIMARVLAAVLNGSQLVAWGGRHAIRLESRVRPFHMLGLAAARRDDVQEIAE